VDSLILPGVFEGLGLLCLWRAYIAYKTLPEGEVGEPAHYHQLRFFGWVSSGSGLLAAIGGGLMIAGLVNLYVTLNPPPHSLQ
jgi:hypothetical protein